MMLLLCRKDNGNMSYSYQERLLRERRMKIIWLTVGARISEEGHSRQDGKRSRDPVTMGSRPHMAMLAPK